MSQHTQPNVIANHNYEAAALRQALVNAGMQFVCFAAYDIPAPDYVAELHALRYEADMTAQFHACNL
jgi:hypothetical protein